MKKKLFILLLVSSLTISGCGNSNTNSTASDNIESSKDTTENSPNADAENIETNQTEQKEPETIIDFEEITIVDNEECTAKITGINPDNFMGYTLETFLENKSSDKTYMFSVTTASINGVQCDPLFAAEVAAGKKSNNEISFTNVDDIGNFTDIEISFRVYDSNDWTADDVAKETVHVYPYGEENAIKFSREAQSTDNIIIDNDYVTVIVTGYDADNIWGYTANLFLINKSEKDIMFSADEASVNGYMVDPFYAFSVAAGKCAFSSISWANTSLEENGITNVEEIEFLFRAYDSNDFMADDFVNEVITLNP